MCCGFRGLQDLIDTARDRDSGRPTGRGGSGVRTRASRHPPTAAFLHRDLAVVRQRQGNIDAAMNRIQARGPARSGRHGVVDSDRGAARARQDFAGAEAAYRQAAAIEPSAELDGASWRRLAERARDASSRPSSGPLPRRRRSRAAIWRRSSAFGWKTFCGVGACREVVVTDITGHWAASWIAAVARAGVIEPFANHTFQPGSPVTRADLASAVSRIRDARGGQSTGPAALPHCTTRYRRHVRRHLSYPAASVAVASGVMPLAAGSRFEVARPCPAPRPPTPSFGFAISPALGAELRRGHSHRREPAHDSADHAGSGVRAARRVRLSRVVARHVPRGWHHRCPGRPHREARRPAHEPGRMAGSDGGQAAARHHVHRADDCPPFR